MRKVETAARPSEVGSNDTGRAINVPESSVPSVPERNVPKSLTALLVCISSLWCDLLLAVFNSALLAGNLDAEVELPCLYGSIMNALL